MFPLFAFTAPRLWFKRTTTIEQQDTRKWEQIKVKVNFTLEQVTKVQRESRGIALLFLSRQMGWVVNATPRPLYPRERPGNYCTGRLVDPWNGLVLCGNSRPKQKSIPGPSSP